jgi:hypothetical protein
MKKSASSARATVLKNYRIDETLWGAFASRVCVRRLAEHGFRRDAGNCKRGTRALARSSNAPEI